MNHLSVGNEYGPAMSDDLIEATLETLVALAVAGAICVGLISLSVHLNEARIARGLAAGTAQTAAATLPSGVANAPTASNFN